MSLESCKLSLKEYIANQSTNQYTPLSTMTSKVWWEQKTECVTAFGGFAHVKAFVEAYSVEEEWTTTTSDTASLDSQVVMPKDSPSFFEYIKAQILWPSEEKTTKSSSIPSQGSKWSSSTWVNTSSVSATVWKSSDTHRYSKDNLIHRGWSALYILWGILVLYLLIVSMRKILQLMYDFFNAHRLVYLKVMQPRWDSKWDREKERELSKDMKEKIGRMSQVFRSMHRLWELGVVDSLANMFFCKAKFTVNLHYEKWLVYFIVSTYPEYQEIIQSAISAQYSDSSIETMVKPSQFINKYRDIVPLEPKKDPVFPIKTFKQIEDDPLNNVIDSMWELGDADTFDIVIHARRYWSWFNRKAQRWAEWLYRNDKNFIQQENIFKKILWIPFGIFDFVFFGKKNRQCIFTCFSQKIKKR